MSYTDFVKPYTDGWENGESGNTPITAEILNNNYDAFLIALNTWASGVPEDSSYVHTDNNYTSTEKTKLGGIATGATATSFDRVVSSGTKLGTLTINGTDYDIYAPNAGAGSLSALSDVTLSSPSNGQVLKYDAANSKWINANESGGGGGYEPTGEVYTFIASGSAAQANLELDVSWTDGSTTEMYVVGDYSNLIVGWGNRDYKNIRTNWDASNQCWKLISKSGYFECGGSYAGEGEVVSTIASGNKVLNAVTYTPGPSVVEWEQIVQSGTKIATITIDGVDTDVYAPTSGGASALSGLSDVTVSNPSNGQVLEYDGTAGKWKNANAPTVPDEITDLDDVDVSSLQNGQILKWNSTSSKWENANESGGGGTTVVANPSGTATEELEKLQVGNTIYSIPEGGGSGGGEFSTTSLFTSSTDVQNITLSDSIENYDAISIIAGYTDAGGHQRYTATYYSDTLMANAGENVNFGVTNDSTQVHFKVTDATHLVRTHQNTLTIEEILGVTYGGGSIFSGKSFVMKTKTYTGTGSATNAITFDEKPYAIFNIYGNGLNGSKVLSMPFIYGETDYAVSSYSNAGILYLRLAYSNNDLTMTITGVDEGAAFNINGSSYTIWYLVEENFNELKDITGTLTAGSTSITLSDNSITTSSTIEVFNDLDIPYNSKTLSTGSITLTFDAQQSDMVVKVRVS